MSTTEDRLRAALRAVADSVPDGSAPPLDLASPGCGGRPRAWFLGGRGRPRNSAWLVPLAAAAAVACVLAGLIVASRVAGPGARHRPSPSQRPAAPPAYALALSQRPRFILWQLPLLRRQRIPAHTSADIVATATGRTAAVATLPGYVENVAADRRGRFYAAVLSRQDRAVRFYEIRRPASGRTAVVTLLPVPRPPRSSPCSRCHRTAATWLWPARWARPALPTSASSG